MKHFRFKHKKKVGGIITGGVDHSEYNSLGDKGIPVVVTKHYKEGGKYNKNYKIAEIEKEELIFNRETALKIDNLISEFEKCKCQGKIVLLGKLVFEALQNTKDETCRKDCVYEPKLKKLI